MAPSRTCKRAFTLVELLVVIAIIAMLVAMLLPAIQSAREAARMTQCKNNIRQLGLSAILHHDAINAFPPARLMPRPFDAERCGVGTPTWMVRVLPYLEEQALFAQWQLDVPYSAHSEATRTQTVSSFFCPSRRDASTSILNSDVTRVFEVSQPAIMGRTVAGWCRGCGPGAPDPEDDDSDDEPSDTEGPEPGEPSDDTEFVTVTYKRGALSDYAGNHGDPSPGFIGFETDFGFGGNGTGVIISSRPKCNGDRVCGWIDRVRLKDLADGTSKTILIGESHVKSDMLGFPPVDGPAFDGNHLPSSSRIGGVGFPLAKSLRDDAPIYSFGSWHSNVCQFVFADGSVRAIDTGIDDVVLGRLAHRRDEVE